MSEKYDVVIAGGGHNALVLGCYLAKAGLSVCIAERNEIIGGGVMTKEYIRPGFKHDVCSAAHTLIQANPLIRNDELGLMSQFGLRYVHPEKMTAIVFDDDSVLEFYSDIDRTCESIAKFSKHDAEAYKRFVEQVYRTMDMLVMGMFNVPPSAGAQAAMLDSSLEGQELMRTQAISSWDVINEWFENEKVKVALTRYASEAMTNPFDNGTGFGFYIILPFMHRYGAGVPIGGSGALSQALARCFEFHGGVIKLASPVKEFVLTGQKATGFILENGEELVGAKAVVSSLGLNQMYPNMVPGFDPPPGFLRNVRNVKPSSFQPCLLHLALNEMPKYRVDGVDDFFWVEKSHATVEGLNRGFRDLEFGIPRRDYIGYVGQCLFDPTRAPPGKGVLYVYGFAPYHLRDGQWDDIKEGMADDLIKDLRALAPNVTDSNIIGRHFMTPLDIERHNPAMVGADIFHFGAFNWQIGGNRPVPGWSQYRTPIEKLYMTGASTHPGGAVSGGPGRNAAQVMFEDLGLDFDKVVS